MKAFVVLGIIAALGAGEAGAADKGPSAASTHHAPKPAEQETGTTDAYDPKTFCYLAGKAYSEGSVVDGRECRRRETAFVSSDNEDPPLSWQPPRVQKKP